MYIAIEGAIGVGKTTLARLLQPTFNAQLLLEVFEENPFLAGFYSDRERYAFQTQIFFLLSRYHQQKEAPKHLSNGDHLIADYTFEKDALFAGINLENDELDVYHEVHEALAEKIIKLLSDRKLRRKLGATGRKQVEGMYTKDIYAINIFKVYEEAVRNYRRGKGKRRAAKSKVIFPREEIRA